MFRDVHKPVGLVNDKGSAAASDNKQNVSVAMLATTRSCAKFNEAESKFQMHDSSFSTVSI